MHIDFILLIIGLYIHAFAVLKLIGFIPHKENEDFRILCLILNIISVVFIVIATILNPILLAFTIFILLFPGMNILPLIIGLTKNKEAYSLKKSFTLKKSDYIYKTQTGVPIAGTGIVLPVDQDFPNITNYIYIPATDEYILLTKDALMEQHDIKVETIQDKNLGKNVFLCLDLQITDKKRVLENLSTIIKYMALVTILIGIIPISCLVTNYVPGSLDTKYPELTSAVGNTMFSIFIGGILEFFADLCESKIVKMFFVLLGIFFVIISIAILITDLIMIFN